MIKKGIIFLIIFLLLIACASGSRLEISSSKIQTKVFPGSEVTYIVKVKNDQLREDRVQVSADPFSIYPFSTLVKSISIKPGQHTIDSEETKSFEVKVKYADDIKSEKSYSVYVLVKSLISGGANERYQLTTFITNSEKTIDMNLDMERTIAPRKETSFDVTFKNNAEQEFKNLKLKVATASYSKEYDFSINAKEEIKRGFTLELEPETPAGEYILLMQIFDGNLIKGKLEETIKIELNKDLEEKITRDTGLFSSTVIITKTNKGNVVLNKYIKYPIGFFENLFTETNPMASYIKEDNQGYLTWNLEIGPGEETKVSINTSYTSLFLTVFVIIMLAGIIYYFNTRSLKIKKRVVMVREGAERKLHFKVIITLQNFTNGAINNLKVLDILPVLIKHYSDFGTLEPNHVQQGSRGLRFIWEIGKLESGEERIISYKIEPQLNLFGNIRLPPASLQYEGKNNKVVIRRSGVAKFNLDKQ